MGSIVLDYTHAMSDVVGSRHGVTPAELDGLAASSKAALAATLAPAAASGRDCGLWASAQAPEDSLQFH